MASTYSTSLRLELMATGDQSGTWGDTTNTNLGTLLEQAITGVLSVAQGDTTLTLTTVNGGSDQARNAVVNLTGAMTAGRNVVVQTANKLYLIKNSTTGGFAVTAKTAAGTGVAIAAGTAQWVYSDGTNVVQGLSGTMAVQAPGAVAITGGTIDGATLTNSTITNYLLLAGGTMTGTLINTGSTVGYTPLQLISTEAAAAAGPIIDVYRNSASPAANDVLGQTIFNGQNSTPAKKEYADISALIVSPTAGAEGGALQFSTILAGTVAPRALIGAGLYTAGATGGDKGADTVNATTYYKAGNYGVITLGSPTASTSGTSVDFTSIPSGARRVTVSMRGVTTSAGSELILQVGDSGGVETSGYTGTSGRIASGNSATAATIANGFGSAYPGSSACNGAWTITLENSPASWVGTFVGAMAGGNVLFAAGSKSLSPGPLDRVRITTAGGTDTFTAGEINITYE